MWANWSRASSGSQHAALNGQRDAGDVTAGIAGEEDQRGAKFVGATEPTGEGAGNNGGFDVCIVELVGHLGCEIAWGQRVDSDALAAGPLLSEIARQTD